MPLGELRTPSTADPARRGIYGFEMQGLGCADELLNRPSEDAPVVSVQRHDDGRPAQPAILTEDIARFEVQGRVGHVEITRKPLEVHLHLPAHVPDQVAVHPFFALPAATMNWWLGRICLHAGAFVTDGAAYALVGDKGAGKTSTLAALHEAGAAIVTDDVLVIDGTDALAGPSCIDLRRETAEWLGGDSTPLGVIGERERFRAATRAAPWRTPLRGFLVPTWGETLGLKPIPVEARLKLLFANQSLFLPPARPEAMLDLVGLDFWELQRPPGLTSLAPTVDLLRALGD